MQRLLIAILSTLVLAAAAAPTYAQEIPATSLQTNSNLVEITPFNLVKRSYRGNFKPEIPSYGVFRSAVRAGKIKALDLVKSAIAAGRLSEDKLNDKSYLSAVQTELDNLSRGN
ncbi:MAG: hypothetical protein ACRC1Z_01075 [Waterburya sp.]